MTGNTGKRRLTALLGAAVGTALILPSSAQAAPEDEHPATRAALQAFQAVGGPGAGLHAGDRTGSWSLSVGTGTNGADRPVQPTDHHRVGSQTKTFTAVAVLQLVDEGKVALDTAIERYLPGVVDGNGYDGDTITVRHLLQHTSGIPTNVPNPKAEPDGTYTLAALVRDGLGHPPAFPPGTSFQYSNTNYAILGMLIEKITGTPVGEVITKRIVEPLGLTGTRYPKPGDRSLADPAVRGYRGVRVGPFFSWTDVTTTLEPSVFHSAGAMTSTERDMAAFFQALVDGRLLSRASLDAMEAPGAHAPYGLGLDRLPLPCGGVAFGHTGGVPGYLSFSAATADGRRVSLMTNSMASLNSETAIARMTAAASTALCENR
ncbi:serine hydrolase domain-containing protein [Streptomyces huiliensis]|uniref:serine hydrolase domain-containing protein n=1 Tax=Streptomyces huiliensis TaxID=2876027 RepID=UPI001CBADD45|nr:serine hydrolase domain-containing protein [Streptomyces huiliensis]MBZ4320441.1 beta-lactamase family protein [Streptomyces huiliensis]